MKSPFVFGKVASSDFFTNREEETKWLLNNWKHQINSILISPRRWGKSSLVKRASEKIKSADKSVQICFLDMFNIKTEQEFYERLASAILTASSTKWEEAIRGAKEFLKNLVPEISVGVDAQSDVSLKFRMGTLQKHSDEVLNLPERLAKRTGKRMIICIDEFQNLMRFDDPLGFQKKLRSAWQHHNSITYCIYGSKRHIISQIFSDASMPFYRFGNMMFLEKIKLEYWIPFITGAFSRTRKKISGHQAEELALRMECHPYYVQQFAHFTWLHTVKTVTKREFDSALEEMILQNDILYQRETDQLTASQINFMLALLAGEEKFTSKDVISKYQFGTAGNVKRIRETLQNKELVDFFTSQPEFNDPLFKIWLQRNFRI